jgi:hypothetical protein
LSVGAVLLAAVLLAAVLLAAVLLAAVLLAADEPDVVAVGVLEPELDHAVTVRRTAVETATNATLFIESSSIPRPGRPTRQSQQVRPGVTYVARQRHQTKPHSHDCKKWG